MFSLFADIHFCVESMYGSASSAAFRWNSRLRLFPSGCHLLFVSKGVAVKMGIGRIRSEIYAWEFYLDEYRL